MPAGFTESVVEEAALEWLAELGWVVRHGLDIAPGELATERADYREVVLSGRLQAAIARLNPAASPEAQEEAFRKATQPDSPSLVHANRAFHKLLVGRVSVEVMCQGEPRGETLRLVDFDDPAANDWLAVNQFTVKGETERRPDVVLFVNGLPLAVIEFKNTADPKATIDTAFKQFQTYQAQIPRLFHFNELLVISDGAETEIGCLTTPRERFAAWKTIDGDALLPSATLEVALKGVFDPRRFLDLVRAFVVFEDDGKTLLKKVAQYHQFHAVRKALDTALAASSTSGDGKGGVLWHTQGSGKSLTMLFFAGKLIAHPALANPTIVMLTDRTDLDDQLHGTFARGKELLRQNPIKADSRAHLRELLRVNKGGVVFTTIQKFFPDKGEEDHPLLSDRRNVVVMADEAHRSHYGFGTRVGQTGKFVRGFADHMRDALPTPPSSPSPAPPWSSPTRTPASSSGTTSTSTTSAAPSPTAPPSPSTTRGASTASASPTTAPPSSTRSSTRSPRTRKKSAAPSSSRSGRSSKPSSAHPAASPKSPPTSSPTWSAARRPSPARR